VFANLVSMVALAAVAALHLVASSSARWAVARGYGVRGAPLSFGFGKAWSLTGPSPRLARWGIAFAGVGASYFVAVLLLAAGMLASGRTVIDETSMRVEVRAGGPAALAGIESGDRILAVDDEPIANWDTLRAAIGRHPAEGVDVLVERGAEQKHLRVVPNVSGKISVGPPASQASVGLGEALLEGVRMPFVVLSSTARGLVRLLRGAEKAELSGPVGVVAEVAHSGLGDVLKLLGALSAYVLPFIALYHFWAAPGVVSRRGTSAHENPARR
jgi:membrane-associated protease RseP (regulator of RpoE activity)